ncbi:MAG: NAD-binding protein, partial [Pseudoflavonifractor sp.]
MKTFVVIGLGRFGTAVARELCELGHEVLALDASEENVAKVADKVTHAVAGDARDPAVLRALGVRNYDCAIVAVGDDVGNSALITLNLKEMGVK